jgi:hypothetical protein
MICSCLVARQSAEKNEEITYSAVNPSKRVVLHWHQKVGPIVTPETAVELKDITVEDSERDEIAPYLNEMDICQLMPLLIGGPDAWTRRKE